MNAVCWLAGVTAAGCRSFVATAASAPLAVGETCFRLLRDGPGFCAAVRTSGGGEGLLAAGRRSKKPRRRPLPAAFRSPWVTASGPAAQG